MSTGSTIEHGASTIPANVPISAPAPTNSKTREPQETPPKGPPAEGKSGSCQKTTRKPRKSRAAPDPVPTATVPPPADNPSSSTFEIEGSNSDGANSEPIVKKSAKARKRKSLSSLGSGTRQSGRAAKRLRADSPCSFNEAELGAFIACKNSNKAQPTLDKYAVYWKQAVDYVARVSTQERRKASSWSAHECEAESNQPENDIEGEDINDGMDEAFDGPSGNPETTMDPEFPQAFTGKPKRCTPEAIVMFLWYKCWKRGCKLGTAHLVKSAILHYYKNLDGDRYRGKWEQDSATGEWKGNPASAGQVEDMMKSLKKKDTEEQTERKHSKAMSYDDMKRVHTHITSICPEKDATDPGQLALRAECLSYLAFASVGFVIWTRNSETCQLQAKHIDWTVEPKVSRDGRHSHVRCLVNVRHRKNWSHKIETGEMTLDGHLYNIYRQPSTPAVDLYHHLSEWKQFYETHLLRRPLQDDDYLFPKMNPANLTAHPDTHITYQAAQKIITKMATNAHLSRPDRYTTHCFRRGGAQYRFMYAPEGQRWTMARIRWWGGWAEKESVSANLMERQISRFIRLTISKGITLMKYLLDELSSYESGHQDAMAPEEATGEDAKGESALAVQESPKGHGGNAFTREDGELLYEKCRHDFTVQLSGFSDRLLGELRPTAGWDSRLSLPFGAMSQQNQQVPLCALSNVPPPHYSITTNPPTCAATPLGHAPTGLDGAFGPSVSPSAVSYSNYNVSFQFSTPYQTSGAPAQYHNLPLPSYTLPSEHSASSTSMSSSPEPCLEQQGNSVLHESQSPPVPKYFVPQINKTAKADAWSIVVMDWEHGRPPHCPPLSTWKPEWYKETKQAQLYHIRRTIATEYIQRYKRNDAAYLSAYPAHKNGLNALYKAIQRARQERGDAQVRETGK